MKNTPPYLIIPVVLAFFTPSSDLMAATVVGATDGYADVSISGEATYSIPLFRPPGSNGLAPDLSLVYGHRRGESIAGVGWGVSGLSRISRCRQTVAQNGSPEKIEFTHSDRYCLDGNQLRHISGTYGYSGSTYRTEIDNISRISATGSGTNGPSQFKVEAKNGLIYEYGYTADSRIESIATGYTTTVRTWALNQMSDRAGNQIRFSYTEDGAPDGDYRIDTIEYRLNPSAGVSTSGYEIEFVFETQPADDVDAAVLVGGPIEDKKRLDRIDVWSKVGTATVVRRYELEYETALSSTTRSRLESIEECVPSSSECLSMTTFTYSDGTSGVSASETISGSVIPSNVRPITLDINGDGRTDIAYPSSSTSGYWVYRLANSSGGFEAAVTTSIVSTGHEKAIRFDYNSDGLGDILVPYSGGTWWAIQGSIAGLQSPVNSGTADETNSSIPMPARSADMNGDGRDDLVFVSNSLKTLTVRYRLASGGFSSTAVTLGTQNLALMRSRNRGPIFDVNGDGFEDVLTKVLCKRCTNYNKIFLGGGSGSSITLIPAFPAQSTLPVNINGDGYVDLAYSTTNGSINYRISAGTTMGSAVTIPSTGDLAFQEAVAIDWNGDGLQDIVAPNSVTGTWYYILSTGDAFDSPVNSNLSTGTPLYGFRSDSDGDGLEDLAYVKSDGKYVYRSHSGVIPDLLEEVTDGNGYTVAFNYAPLTESSVYTKHSDATFPQQDYQSGMQVVESIERSDGNGGTFTVDYSYAGAQRNVEGRGLTPFAARTIVDNRNGNKIEESYGRDFPYIGTLTNRKLRLSDTTLVMDTSLTWQKKTAGSGFEDYHHPYVSQVVEKNYEAEGTYNGNQVNEITVTNTVDSYGTVTDSTSTTVESSTANGAQSGANYFQRTLLTSLTNSASTWCLGKPGRVERINSHSGTYGTQITRTTDLTWDTTSNCRVNTIIVEPDGVHSGNSTYQVTTALVYDSFGNVNSQTVTGKSMTARTTTTNWGTYGQVPNTVTNALSQATTYGWDYETGDMLSVTDPNGLARSWLYDEFGRRTRETRPDGTYTEYSLTDCNAANSYCGTSFTRIKTKARASSKTTSGSEIRYDDTYLDILNRNVQSSRQALGGSTVNRRIHFDSMGRVSRRYMPTFATTPTDYEEITYDLLGRPDDISRPIDDGNPTLQHTYVYYEGLTRRVIDAEGNESKTVNDVFGRVYRTIDDNGYYVQFELDAFGSLRRTKDSLTNGLNEATYAYGVGAFRVSMNDMDFGSGWTYTPNALGEVTAYTDAKSQSFSATFDKLGRPLTRAEVEGTTTWTWGTSAASNNIGRLASVSSPGHSQSFTYDSYGRLQQHRHVGGGAYDIDYAHDSSTGLLSSVEYPTSTGGYRFKVLQDYDYGVLKRVKRSDSPNTVYWEAQTQDAFGNITDEDFGNGSTTIRGFDGVTGRIDYIETDKGVTTLQNLSYTWDKVGNLLQRKDWRQTNYPTEDFSYDSLNRLTDADVSGAATDYLNVTYEQNGNIKSKDDVSGSNWTYHSTKKHAIVIAGSNGYGYDGNGNMSSRKGDAITWTSYNYPSEIEDGPRTFEYSYDAGRQKWKQVYDDNGTSETTYFVGRIFEKNVNSSDTEHRHHIMANGRAVALFVERTSGSDYVRYVTHDHLGSTDGFVESSGTTTYVNESFSVYGERRDPVDWVGGPSAGDLAKIANTTDRSYTDHISLEATTLVHMNGRVYDAEIGRFLSPDPIVQSPTNSQNWNRYSYVINGPLSNTDPSGYICRNVRTQSGKDNMWVSSEVCVGLSSGELARIENMIRSWANEIGGAPYVARIKLPSIDEAIRNQESTECGGEALGPNKVFPTVDDANVDGLVYATSDSAFNSNFEHGFDVIPVGDFFTYDSIDTGSTRHPGGDPNAVDVTLIASGGNLISVSWAHTHPLGGDDRGNRYLSSDDREEMRFHANSYNAIPAYLGATDGAIRRFEFGGTQTGTEIRPPGCLNIR